jgi:hypothetical protein
MGLSAHRQTDNVCDVPLRRALDGTASPLTRITSQTPGMPRSMPHHTTDYQTASSTVAPTCAGGVVTLQHTRQGLKDFVREV